MVGGELHSSVEFYPKGFLFFAAFTFAEMTKLCGFGHPVNSKPSLLFFWDLMHLQ